MDKRKESRDSKIKEEILMDLRTNPIINAKKSDFDFERCQACKTKGNISKTTIGSETANGSVSTSVKLCKDCAHKVIISLETFYFGELNA